MSKRHAYQLGTTPSSGAGRSTRADRRTLTQ